MVILFKYHPNILHKSFYFSLLKYYNLKVLLSMSIYDYDSVVALYGYFYVYCLM